MREFAAAYYISLPNGNDSNHGTCIVCVSQRLHLKTVMTSPAIHWAQNYLIEQVAQWARSLSLSLSLSLARARALSLSHTIISRALDPGHGVEQGGRASVARIDVVHPVQGLVKEGFAKGGVSSGGFS